MTLVDPAGEEMTCPVGTLRRMPAIDDVCRSTLPDDGERVPVSMRKREMSLFLDFMADESEEAVSRDDLVVLCQVANFTGASPSDASIKRLGRRVNAALMEEESRVHKAFRAMPVDCRSLAAEAIFHAIDPASVVEAMKSIAPITRESVVSHMREKHGRLEIAVPSRPLCEEEFAHIMCATEFSAGMSLRFEKVQCKTSQVRPASIRAFAIRSSIRSSCMQ